MTRTPSLHLRSCPENRMGSEIEDQKRENNRPPKRRKYRRVRNKERSPSPPPSPPWTELPRDITANILQRLTAIEILETAQKVCTTWRSVCTDPDMWRIIDMRNPGDLQKMPYDLEKMCCHAVDRSQGQLVDINLQYFATDELLDYIAERSGQLRCLRLACCDYVSSEGLIKAIKRFPWLEELHICLTPISPEAIEMVGQSCPLLQSFTRNSLVLTRRFYRCDKVALAIARSMPKLHSLQLLGNSLTNEGLQAILDDCPLLESLDLRSCQNVELEGDLGKRCSAQIKHLRFPSDSAADYEFQMQDIVALIDSDSTDLELYAVFNLF